MDTKWKAVLTHGILRMTKCGVCSYSRADSANHSLQVQDVCTKVRPVSLTFSIHEDSNPFMWTVCTLSWFYIDPLFPHMLHKYAKK